MIPEPDQADAVREEGSEEWRSAAETMSVWPRETLPTKDLKAWDLAVSVATELVKGVDP